MTKKVLITIEFSIAVLMISEINANSDVELLERKRADGSRPFEG